MHINNRSAVTEPNRPFTHIDADIPNFGGIKVGSELTEGGILKEGTPVAKDDTDGLAHVLKFAVVYEAAGNTATDIKVEKGSNLEVGDLICVAAGGASYAITTITTTNTSYDVITIGTTLGVAIAVGAVIYQSDKSSGAASGASPKYKAIGLVGESYTIEKNLWVRVVTRGQAVESLMPYKIGKDIKDSLPGINFI